MYTVKELKGKINRKDGQEVIHLNGENEVEEEVPCLSEFDYKDNNDFYMVMVGAGKLCVFANSKRKMIPKTFQLACNLAIQTFEAE